MAEDEEVHIRVAGEDALSAPLAKGRGEMKRLKDEVEAAGRALDDYTLRAIAAGRASDDLGKKVKLSSGRTMELKGATAAMDSNILRARQRFDELSLALQRSTLNAKSTTSGVDKMSGKFKALAGVLTKVRTIGLTVFKFAGMAALIQPAAAALSAIGAGGVSAVAGLAPLLSLGAALPSAMLTGATALGVLKFGLSGVSEAAAAIMNPNTSPAAMAAAFRGLSPAAASLATQLGMLERGPLNDLQGTLATALLPGLSSLLTAVQGLIPVIGPVLQGTASAISDIASSAATMMSSPLFTGELTRVMGNNNTVLAIAGGVILNLAQAGLAVLDAFRPVFLLMAEAGARTGDYLKNLTATNDANGKMTAFFMRAWELAQNVWDVVSNLGHAFYNIGKEAMGLANVIGGGLSGSIQKFREWTESLGGQNAIKKWFAEAVPVFQALGTLILAVIGAFGQLAGSGGAGASSLLGSITKVLGSLATIISSINFAPIIHGFGTLVTILGLVASGYAHMNPHVQDAVKSFGGVLIGTGLVATAMSAVLSPIASVASNVSDLKGGYDDLKGSFKEGKQAVTDVINGFRGITTATEGANGAGIASGFSKAGGALKLLMIRMGIFTRVVTPAVVGANGEIATSEAVVDSLNPLGWVILIVAAVIAFGVAMYELYQHVTWFRNAVNSTWGWMKGAGEAIGRIAESFGRFFRKAYDETLPLIRAIESIYKMIKNLGNTAPGWLKDLLGIPNNPTPANPGKAGTGNTAAASAPAASQTNGKYAAAPAVTPADAKTINTNFANINQAAAHPGQQQAMVPVPFKAFSARAAGGPVTAGMNVLFGEQGPEAFVSNAGAVSIIGANGPGIDTFRSAGLVLPTPVLEAARAANVPLSDVADAVRAPHTQADLSQRATTYIEGAINLGGITLSNSTNASPVEIARLAAREVARVQQERAERGHQWVGAGRVR